MSTVHQLSAVVAAMNRLLRVDLFRDYAPNGLQIEGRAEVRKIVTGVSACEALIDAAIEAKADAILVHHGYFWKNENPVITGYKARRIKKLLESGISLIGYHLPLDGHRTLGNNWQLAQKLAFEDISIIKNGEIRPLENNNTQLLFTGTTQEQSLDTLATHIGQVLQREPMIIEGNANRTIQRVGWCTGAAQDAFSEAIAVGCDVFITGEVSERTYHEAKETGVHFIAAGHHATERYGVQALGAWLESHLDIQAMYIDIDNPV